MGASTLCIGCLPTYASMGLLATILLAGMRLMQGLSVGGEFVGSLVFAIESAPAHHRVLAGSLCTASATFGVSLGSWTGLLLNATFSEDKMRAFGWRLPFLGGVLIGAFAFWARAQLEESPQARSSLQARDTANAQHSADAEGAMDAVGPATMPMYACMHACLHTYKHRDRKTDGQLDGEREREIKDIHTRCAGSEGRGGAGQDAHRTGAAAVPQDHCGRHAVNSLL